MAAELTVDEAEAFRLKCRAFLEANQGPTGTFDDNRAYVGALAEAGLAGLTYPVEYGGAGLTSAHDRIWRSEKAGFTMRDGEFIISHGMCVPMLNEYGTHEQKLRFMPDAIAGRTLFCQMFSEPGAGSDVASLQTKAELDGDEWRITGQKVWTTLAHKSDYGIIIARTNPDAPKHAGISMFVVDLKAPGVEIRPIHQIDGGKHFNEVFFTDVRVPADWLIGDLNNGWRLSTAMLMYERVAIGTSTAGQIKQPTYDMLRRYAKASGAIDNPVVRDQLIQMYIRESCKSLVALRTRSEQKAGKTPGPGGSLGKLMTSMNMRFMRSIAQEIAGVGSIAWSDDDPTGPDLQRIILNSFAAAIAGGTDEIQRNIIGDRVLGLPREPSIDTKLPFKDLKVGTQR